MAFIALYICFEVGLSGDTLTFFQSFHGFGGENG